MTTRYSPTAEFPELGKNEYFRTGSSVICDPPVTNTDIDIVTVYTDELHIRLKEAGYISSEEAVGIEYDNPSVNCCYRNGNVNIIAVPDAKSFWKWKTYTELAKLMNLKDKRQRVVLAQFITEGAVRDTGITY